MSFWGKIALVAAGGLLGAAATRIARAPGQDLTVRAAGRAVPSARADDWRSRLYRFATAVRAGMDEREAELRESFGVTAPRRPSFRPAARGAAPEVLGGAASSSGAPARPTDSPTDREGRHR